MVHLTNFDRVMETKDHFKNEMRLKILKITGFLLVAFTLSQCKPGTGKYVQGELIEIDVSKHYPVKELYLQDIAKVEYIPFETNINTLMRMRTDMIVYVSDDYIIATNRVESDIFVFDGKGKSKFSFNHKGQGPTNYNNLWGGIAFDEKTKEIFLFDRFAANPRIQIYADNGEYKRTLAGFSDLRDIKVYHFDDETLLVYDESGIFGQRNYSHKPYLLISKKDGSVSDTLNILLPVRLSSTVVWQGEQNGQPVTYSIGIPITNNRSYGKNFLIVDWSADTIYKLTPQRELQPMIVRKPPMQDTDPKILISNFLVTEKFLLLGIYVMDYNALKNGGDISQKQIMYDFETGQINEYRLKNRDIASSTSVMFHEAVTSESIGVSAYDVAFLFELDEKGEIKGDLKELLKSLKEEDNPVLMKIKF